MPIIASIPSVYESGFEELANISEDSFSKIADNLAKVPSAASLKTLANKLGELIEFDAFDILSSVGSLVPLIEKEEMIDELVHDVVTISVNNDLITSDEQEILGNRLQVLLKNKSIYLSSKASDLSNNYGNVFLNCRIVSDIRPIFDTNLDAPITASVIMHNLNIHYQSNDEPYHKDINLVLTAEDLQELKESINRAEKKEQLLKTILDNSKITILGQ